MDTKDNDQLASAKASKEQAERDLKAAQKEADKALRDAKEQAAMEKAQARAEAQKNAANARIKIAEKIAIEKEKAKVAKDEKTIAVEYFKDIKAEKKEAKAEAKASSKDEKKALAEYGQVVKDLQKAREKLAVANEDFRLASTDLKLSTEGRNKAEEDQKNAKNLKAAASIVAEWTKARIEANKKFVAAEKALSKAQLEFDDAKNAEKIAKQEFDTAQTAKLTAEEKLNVATEAKLGAAELVSRKVRQEADAKNVIKMNAKAEAQENKKAAVQEKAKASVDARINEAKKQIIKDNEKVIKKIDAELKQQARKEHGAEFWRRGPLRKAEHQQERENQKKMLMELKKSSDLPLGSLNKEGLETLKNTVMQSAKNNTINVKLEINEAKSAVVVQMFHNHLGNGGQRVADKLYEIAKTTNSIESLQRKNEFLIGLRNPIITKDILLDKTGKGMEILKLAKKSSFAGEVGELVRKGMGDSKGKIQQHEPTHILIASEMCLKAPTKEAAEARMNFLKEHFMDKSSIIGDYRVNSQNLQHIADKFESTPSFKKGGDAIKIGDMSTVERRDMAASLVGHYPTLYSALKEGHNGEMTNRQFISLAKDLNKELEKAGGLKAFEDKLLNDPDSKASLVGVLKENKVSEKDAKGKNTVDVGIINVKSIIPDQGASQGVNNPQARGGHLAKYQAGQAAGQQQDKGRT